MIPGSDDTERSMRVERALRESAVFTPQSMPLVWCYQAVDSTMDEARRLAPCVGDGQIGIVVARAQRAGRGRQGRQWMGSEGALAATFILPHRVQVERLLGLSLVAGCVVAEVCRALGADVVLKWPNDVLTHDGKKLAGVLIELLQEGEGAARRGIVLAGIGMNMRRVPSGVPEGVSLFDLCGSPVEVEDFVPLLAGELWRAWQQFIIQGFACFRDRWLAQAWGLSRNIAVDTGDQIVTGRILGVGEFGELLLSSHGQVVQVTSGHVIEK